MWLHGRERMPCGMREKVEKEATAAVQEVAWWFRLEVK
jgi:hypothetical protein